MEKGQQQGENPNNPPSKDVITISSSDSQEHSQPENLQTGNTYTQTGGGTHNPQIQGVNQFSPHNFNMGCGATNDRKGDTNDRKGDTAK